MINYKIEWQYYLNFFAYLLRINFTPFMYGKSAILYKVARKSPINVKELIERYGEICKAHEDIQDVLLKNQHFND